MPTSTKIHAPPVVNEEAWLGKVRANAPAQNNLNAATLLPLERLAVATRIDKTPQGPDDPIWADVPRLGRLFLDALASGFDEHTDAAVAFDDKALYVRVECAGKPARPTFSKSYYRADCVELFLDCEHDHFHYLQLAITAGGACVGGRKSRPLDSQRWENKIKSEELAAGLWSGKALIAANGWSAQFTVPLELLGKNYQSGVGFNLLRSRCDGMFPVSLWNETHAGPHAPWAFGQLYFGKLPPVHVEQVDLGELHLWENRGELLVRNPSGVPSSVELKVTVTCGEKEDRTFYSHEVSAALPASSDRTAIKFSFPFDPEDYKFHHLHLELKAAGKRDPFWRATYRFGRGQVGWLLQIDDRREGPPIPNPDPSDPEFMKKKRLYIVRNIPRFVRKSTAQGAPSDFTLEASDGSVRFDLMKAGALQRMADYIYSSYDNDIDRLLGATMFIHQTAVMTYANTSSSVVASLSPLSVIRFGSAQCCCFAAALLGLLEKMKCAETGHPYRGTRVGVPGHVTTVVEFRGKLVHLDPSVGRFYYLRDNKTLASMDDLLRDPSLAGRASPYLEKFHREASLDADSPHYYRPERAIWPVGAPEE
jgi:hypothetical protein